MFVDADVSEKHKILSTSSRSEVTRQGNKRAYIGPEEQRLKEGR
jgi:hypothetical protein